MIYSSILIPVIAVFALIGLISFGVVAYKRRMSFGSIIAVLGSVLIATGFAWLITQNWHYFPAPIKIFILVLFTLGAYITGVILKEKDYPAIAKALFVTGALLYTLSIFLIAQIFQTKISIQNYAWLTLLAWVGVSFSSYFFSSYTIFIIAIFEFLAWLPLQFTALLESISRAHITNTENLINFPVFAVFLLLFLIAGIFFYGLSLWHRAYQHNFSKLFQWVTVFYCLAIVYILTFQYLIPIIWRGEWKIPIFSSPIIFLFSFTIISLISFVSGIFVALNQQKASAKEIFIVLGIIIIVIVLLLLTKLPANVLGTCYIKNCYDFKNQNECNNAPLDLDCAWKTEGSYSRCEKRDCYDFKDKSSCSPNYYTLGCKWENTSYSTQETCQEIDCYLLKDQSSCLSAPPKLKCIWQNNLCSRSYSEVVAKGGTVKNKCSPYDNKKSECLPHSECGWRAGDSYWWGGSKGKSVPLVLWFVWIIINIFFVLLTLGVIGYGTLEKSPAIINLGIMAFGGNILTRYIGFIMDLWGYMTLSIIFISGGIILIFAGWLIERWRRKLVREVIGEVNE